MSADNYCMTWLHSGLVELCEELHDNTQKEGLHCRVCEHLKHHVCTAHHEDCPEVKRQLNVVKNHIELIDT